uniref:Calponin-homology (CH) domain-containing protein n=1 Tax=Ascaris lumbricoides TaxID=6252 RepID=A0A0M3IWU1_ASCLU
MEIVDLFIDVGDGVILMKLLEIISGEKLGKPNRGRMRVQKIENLNKTLDFLKRKRIQISGDPPCSSYQLMYWRNGGWDFH